MPGLMPDSYDCKTCGENHKFGTWVYAHWDTSIHHTCLKCNTLHSIHKGVANRISWPTTDVEVVNGVRKATA